MIKVSQKLELYHAEIVRRVEKKKRAVLFKQGGYLRTTMQRSMRYATSPKQRSRPGRPPLAHKRMGALLRKLIAFDVEGDTVTVGPKIFAGSKVRSSKTLPELLDKGGVTEIGAKRVSVHIAARPYTEPTFSDGGEHFRRLIETERL